MDALLVLTHRIPYPPDKGDKIRSWHFLEHLARRYDVYLGTFIDDRRDWEFTDKLRDVCRDCFFARLNPTLARLRSLRGFFSGNALTIPYYYDRALDRWVRRVLDQPGIERVFIYCSAMAQYIPLAARRSLHAVADLVDVDSQKWFEYGQALHGMKAVVSRREGTTLRRVEREIALTFSATFVSTRPERDLFRTFAPESAQRIEYIRNGVDSDYFSPERGYECPEGVNGTPFVFTGAMDYWPNVDAATYFVNSIFPRIRQRIPGAQALIVGSNPSPAVRALANDTNVVVTGRVPDVRPYIAHAKAVIAPLRIARGVQNKVLEGMAMAKPVIASPEAAIGIEARPGKDLLVVEGPEAFAAAAESVAFSGAGTTIGQHARQRIVTDYGWSTSASRIEAALDA